MFGWLFKRKSKRREIVVNVEKLETRVAVVENGRVEEFQVEHPMEERLVGCIFKGRIQNLEHDLQAAFVDIGLKKNAFLHYWDMIPDEDGLDEDDDNRASKRKRISNDEIAKRFPPGSEIVVQVTKGPIGTKGPRVTANLSLPGRYLVMMPSAKSTRGVSRKIADAKERLRLKKILDRLPLPPGVGIIVRTVGSGANQRAFCRDLRNILDVWGQLQHNIKTLHAPACVYSEPDLVERVVRDWLTEDIDRVIIDDAEAFNRIREVAGRISRRARRVIELYKGHLPIFDHYGVETQMEEAFRRKVNLKSGGYLVIDETEALIAVDVNTGRHRGKGSQEEAILEVNMEAVEEVARQLRLRNIGGLVVIDLIDMKSRKHQNQIYKAMKAAVKRDRARTNVLPISELGLMEMTRQRQEESLLSQMYIDCPYCKGHGVIKSPLALSVDIQRQIAAVMRKQQSAPGATELQVLVAPSVMERLRNEDEQMLVEMQRRYSGKLTFKCEVARHPESFAILDRDGKVLYAVSESRAV